MTTRRCFIAIAVEHYSIYNAGKEQANWHVLKLIAKFFWYMPLIFINLKHECFKEKQ
jgi:hypothetical protein